MIAMSTYMNKYIYVQNMHGNSTLHVSLELPWLQIVVLSIWFSPQEVLYADQYTNNLC